MIERKAGKDRQTGIQKEPQSPKNEQIRGLRLYKISGGSVYLIRSRSTSTLQL